MPVDSATTLVRGARYEIDAFSGAEFDEIATLACALCRTPQSMVMIKDQQHRWRRVSGSLRLRDTAVAPAFCESTLKQSEALIVEDTARDHRFAAEPQVTGEPHIRLLRWRSFLQRGSPHQWDFVCHRPDPASTYLRAGGSPPASRSSAYRSPRTRGSAQTVWIS